MPAQDKYIICELAINLGPGHFVMVHVAASLFALNQHTMFAFVLTRQQQQKTCCGRTHYPEALSWHTSWIDDYNMLMYVRLASACLSAGALCCQAVRTDVIISVSAKRGRPDDRTCHGRWILDVCVSVRGEVFVDIPNVTLYICYR